MDTKTRVVLVELPHGPITQQQRHHMQESLAKALADAGTIEQIRLGQPLPTVRELAAIAAMQGALANSALLSHYSGESKDDPTLRALIAGDSVAMADALLAALAKPVSTHG